MPMARAPVSGISLTAQDASLVKGMLLRGDRQHDIASWFGVNGGRIAEISTRTKFSDVLMQTDRLPPAGPYLTGKQSHEAKIVLKKVYDDLMVLKAQDPYKNSSNDLERVTKSLNQVLATL